MTEGAVAKDHIAGRGGRLIADEPQCGQQPTAAVACPRPSANLTAVLGSNDGERLQRRAGSTTIRRTPARISAARSYRRGGSRPSTRASSGGTASPDDQQQQTLRSVQRRLDQTLRQQLLQVERGSAAPRCRPSATPARSVAAGGPHGEVGRPPSRIVQHAQLNNRLADVATHVYSNTTSPARERRPLAPVLSSSLSTRVCRMPPRRPRSPGRPLTAGGHRRKIS